MSKLIPEEILLFGLLIVLSIFIYKISQKFKIPGLIGFMLVGFCLRLVDRYYSILNESLLHTFEFLGNIGIVVLLFKVGLESNLPGLLKQLKSAILIWVGNVFVSGFLGYVVLFYLLKMAFVPSLIVAVALTATSVGISVGVWKEQNAINSRCGELVVDVAELDDISGVMFMGILFVVLPILKTNANSQIGSLLLTTSFIFFIKMVFFLFLCFIFAKHIEPKITKFFQKDSSVNPILMITGTSFIISGLAGFLDLSVAIGAFFAGLIFSQDPEHEKIDFSFTMIYQLFYPFFFIHIGLSFDPASLTHAFKLGGVLIAIAVLGKLIGTFLPAIFVVDKKSSLLLSLSMVPRSEIAMLIIAGGLKLGSWAVPAEVFNAMVFVCIATSLLSPIILKRLLIKWPQGKI